MDARPASFYVKALRPLLPGEAFAPNPARLFWLALHLATVAVGIALLARGPGLLASLALSLVIGHAFTGMAFVGHELLHGSIVKSRRAAHLIGWVCLLPFTLSPRLWKAWHNRMHHGNTMIAGVDPDAYPTLEAFSAARATRLMERFSVARGHLLGLLCFPLGFTGQSTQLLFTARSRGYLTPGQHRLALLESLLGVLTWAALGWWLGPLGFLFAFVLPLLVANTVAMAYILTNHNLNPLTQVNDPLLNSLTVTVPRFFDLLHSRFGLHVEHHLFPAVSSDHLPRVRELLLERWPERYQSMSLSAALASLMRTPRIYREATVLVDPRTGYETRTLLPRPAATAEA